jgi:ATP-dependent 26S proteasome regulatory subunit
MAPTLRPEHGQLILWHGAPGTGKTYGQGLSRLLNVVDGLIGQGLRLIVLVTTNEVLRRLHPAVARPGRCEHVVEFAAFTADEAAAWLERHGSDAAAGQTSLYARAAGIQPEQTKHPLGFTA